MAPMPHTRRSLLGGSLAVPVGLALSSTLSGAFALPAYAAPAPAFTRSGRPNALWGVQSGEITANSATVWARSDRPARMYVETSPSESFRYAVRRHRGPLLGPGTDFTGTATLRELPPGQQIHYRVVLADPDDPRRTGEPVRGTFRTTPPPAAATCASCGPGTSRARAGASTRRSAATASSTRCGCATPTSSSSAGTPSTPTGLSRPPSPCATAPCGTT